MHLGFDLCYLPLIMLKIDNLTYRIAGRTLFEETNAHIAEGQRVGLVGKNGAGKTTLFGLIMGELHPDAGSVRVRAGAKMGSVAQEIKDSSASLLDFTLSHDKERASLMSESESCQDGFRQAEIEERLGAIDAYTAPSRAAQILSGLGFDAQSQTQPLGTFSGGWRMRAALAGALFAQPELLLLDEPTNHLDLEATIWLQNHLASYPGTLVIISHDRELLNVAVNRILHVDQLKLFAYGGNYDRFVDVRRQKIELLGKAAVKQADKRAKLQAFVDRFRAKATKARQAQSRLKMLERLGPPIAVIEDQETSFNFPNPEELAPPVISITNGKAGYEPGRAILSDLSLRIDMDDRIALLGANGNGKSTMAKILAGRLSLQDGDLFRSPKLRIGYFAQHQTEELNLEASPYDHMAALMKGALPAKIRAQLGRFGFTQNRAMMKVGNMSGGEKARLLFALMTKDAPHLMILDEPTNHLDIDARDALVEALNEYQGAVVLISHDPHIIELVADRLWLVDGGKVSPYDGDLNDYRQLLQERARDARRAGQPDKPSMAARKDERRNAAERRQRLAPLKKVVDQAEREVAKRQKVVDSLAAKLEDPDLYNDGGAKASEVTRLLAEAKNAQESAEAIWIKAYDEYEKAEALEG